MSVRVIKTEADKTEYLAERELVSRWREAVGFCKRETNLGSFPELVPTEGKMEFEKCITKNYLLK